MSYNNIIPCTFPIIGAILVTCFHIINLTFHCYYFCSRLSVYLLRKIHEGKNQYFLSFIYHLWVLFFPVDINAHLVSFLFSLRNTFCYFVFNTGLLAAIYLSKVTFISCTFSRMVFNVSF